VLPSWFGWWSCVACAWDQGLQGLPGLVERLLGIDAELACLDREAVSGRRQALVALCRGCLGWCVQDEGAVSPAGVMIWSRSSSRKTRAMVAVATPRSRASWRMGGRRAPWGSTPVATMVVIWLRSCS
jgi:hypothetical protein